MEALLSAEKFVSVEAVATCKVVVSSVVSVSLIVLEVVRSGVVIPR